MFQIKNFVSIAASMINHVRGTQTQVTDFNVGAVGRTIMEASAVEIEALYQQVFNGLMEAIPVATYRSFNFDALPAVAATGVGRVTITAQATDTLISAGTIFTSTAAGASYVSVFDVTIAAGDTQADILVAASLAGVVGNIPANLSFTLSPAPAGFVSATNLAAFTNGQEAETDDQRKQRFVQYIQTLQRGTVSALVYGAKTAFLTDANGVETERVKAASVIEPYVTDNSQPISLVNVYVHNGVGSTSVGLVSQAQTVLTGYTDSAGNKIPGWKAAGVHMVVAVATEVDIAVTAVTTVDPSYDQATVLGAVQAVLENYILGLDLGESFLFAEAVTLAMQTPGVLNIVFTTPTADHTATDSQKLMPGTFSVTAA